MRGSRVIIIDIMVGSFASRPRRRSKTSEGKTSREWLSGREGDRKERGKAMRLSAAERGEPWSRVFSVTGGCLFACCSCISET